MNIYEKLMNVQTKLKAPKSQRNNFGNYNYRSCEDILEALKPIMAEQKVALIINDEPLLIGERHYIKATARLIDIEKGEHIEVSALAREEDTKKGMDSSQITGSTSSYARKYALNGLFCIDDTKDSDATNDHGKGNQNEAQNKRHSQKNNDVVDQSIDEIKIQAVKALCKRKGVEEKTVLDFYKYDDWSAMPMAVYNQAIAYLNKKKDKVS
ncbi:ERF family protein [Anaerosolibacter sp.]|uniref:ERF family protein n=1 Tax=Anaerosolibacter sp. TaxID=1872527 RepID=UPI0039EDF228